MEWSYKSSLLLLLKMRTAQALYGYAHCHLAMYAILVLIELMSDNVYATLLVMILLMAGVDSCTRCSGASQIYIQQAIIKRQF
ncbi:hypothetical protein V8B55DRAFT_1598368 [Mucor lusitanicus]|uniref:Uncharacterized protein n=1 Tax=Mucor circinelloides f. lusitanicus TaxID=29924 RepID=A0A8H4BC91_MUCCL|nr:hypothetical protein FB192DRAFT_1394358 [Mucor lusitanicus]